MEIEGLEGKRAGNRGSEVRGIKKRNGVDKEIQIEEEDKTLAGNSKIYQDE